MLRAIDLTVRAGRRALLDSVTVAFAPGELTALVGPNGAGKTTLLRCLDGELQPAAGGVALGGRALADWPRVALARARAVLPQESTLNFPFSALDVVLLGRIPHATGNAADAAIARRALALCDCAGFAERDYTSLSGGEKQRVQTARVLAQILDGVDVDDGDGDFHPRHPRSPRLKDCGGDESGGGDSHPRHPRVLLSGGDGDHVGDGESVGDGVSVGDGEAAKFLLLDEPVSALDLRHQYRLLDLLKRLTRAGLGIITALHNLNLVAQFAERAVIIERGRLVADGAPLEVFTAQTLSQVFALDVGVHPHPDDATLPLLLPKLPVAVD